MKYVVIIEWDNADPEAHGPKDSHEEAQQLKKNLLDGFDDFDQRHLRSISISQLYPPK